ncbi:MAG: NAD(P)-binding domain-containing protein, partial [Cytophagales bacterium]|nr:NAD(P)-binding domain-containing protein [Cytophagales bacterium]
MKVAIIGGGNMGLTYARSFLHYKLVDSENLLIVEKNIDRAHSLQYNDKYVTATELDSQLTGCDVVIIAVKPQDFIALSQQLKSFLAESQLVISIMAGISLAKL